MTLTKIDAGWSSLVARRAHNPKVGGSNPPPATKIKGLENISEPFLFLIKTILPCIPRIKYIAPQNTGNLA
jgi:hypothetical protein